MIRALAAAIAADHDSMRAHRAKYRGESIPRARLPLDLITKIGLQMASAVRVMQALEGAGVPLLPMVVSRVIRHAYGAEIHWQAQIEPGISIVHGNGLVISHRARVEPGCILFHNVTLGEGVDPVTRESGAPHLGRNVHVGPGATLLGPIHVGEGSKIMAGAVLMRSVPPNSLVKPAEATVSERAAVSARTR